MSGPLEGIRVVELATWAAMPAAGAILSDWGADVIKIEDPRGGDAAREWKGQGMYPFELNLGPIFEVDNRNKRSVGLDLRVPAAREILYRLIEKADVFITNYEPEVLQRFDLEYDDLKRINRRLIYAVITGYGDSGPEAGKPGYDWTVWWARAGLLLLLGEPDAPLVIPRPGVGDHSTGTMAAGAIAAALFAREKSGEGQRVSVALYHTALWNFAVDIQAGILSGKNVPSMSRSMSKNPLTLTYRAGDGKWLMLVMAQSERYWTTFCRAIGRVDLEADPRFVSAARRAENSMALTHILDDIFASKTRQEWEDILTAHGCVYGGVQSIEEIISDEQVWSNRFLVSVDHPSLGKMTLVASPASFSGTPSTVRAPAPLIGQHTEEVLLEYGYTREDLAQLKGRGAIV